MTGSAEMTTEQDQAIVAAISELNTTIQLLQQSIDKLNTTVASHDKLLLHSETGQVVKLNGLEIKMKLIIWIGGILGGGVIALAIDRLMGN